MQDEPEIKCRILEVYPETHSITIRYYSDKVTQDLIANEFDTKGRPIRRKDGTPTKCKTDLHLQLPVPAPKGTELLDFIFKAVPPNRMLFDLQEKILDPNIDTTLSHIVEMAKPEHFFLVPKSALTRSDGVPRRQIIPLSDVGVPTVKVEEF